MEAASASRAKLKHLLQTFYAECAKCQERREEEVTVLPCFHVVCKSCVARVNQLAIKSATSPKACQRTQYHDHRRFECPVCRWPQYLHFGSEGFDKKYPSRLPLHKELLAMGDSPPRVVPYMTIKSDGENKANRLYSYETRQGNYVFESVIGEFGPHCAKGQMSRITGLAVDESDPMEPLVVVCESKENFILTFHLSGRLEHARETGIKIWDVCIGERGTVIASVAEQNYALAKWDSGRTPHGGIRHENIFRNIYGHSAAIHCEPFGVTTDSQGRFFVSVLAKDRVCRWDPRRVGDHLYWFGTSGETGNGLNGPYYVAKMSKDLTVVSSTNSHKVKVIDDEKDMLVMELGGLGCDAPDLCYPRGVCVDSNDNIYIADTGNFRVVVYDRNGDFVGFPVSETWNYGTDVKPTNVAVMQDGRLLVAMQGRGYCKVHVYAPLRDTGSESGECDCQCSWFSFFASCCCISHRGYEPLD
ncbi:tripartite motif-containing protein 3-like [Littorina saxatilis]|uniref:RING-type domain-containing protein n=1 Tax=Littorina saxatilis TaxID=31220 RepID=A0AAN9G7F9_9CAEN